MEKFSTVIFKRNSGAHSIFTGGTHWFVKLAVLFELAVEIQHDKSSVLREREELTMEPAGALRADHCGGA